MPKTLPSKFIIFSAPVVAVGSSWLPADVQGYLHLYITRVRGSDHIIVQFWALLARQQMIASRPKLASISVRGQLALGGSWQLELFPGLSKNSVDSKEQLRASSKLGSLRLPTREQDWEIDARTTKTEFAEGL